jgi:hypothetical protein
MPTLSERAAAALVGAVVGALLGSVLAWLLGVYSNTLGPGQVAVSFPKWAVGGAAVFGGLGALFGSSVGTLLGAVIAGISSLEGSEERHIPWWAIVPVMLGVACLVLWLARSGGAT